MIITPFAFMAPSGPTPPPSSGLVGWYDADDYTTGTTWVDRSGNGNNLTLSGTYSKDASTMGGGSVLMNTAGATSTIVSDWSATTEITHIEIVRLISLGSFKGSWGLDISGTGVEPSGFQLNGIGWIYTWVGGGTGYYLNGRTYSTTYNTFVARRLQSGFDNSGTLNVSYGDSNAVNITHYGAGNFTLGRGGSTVYSTTGTEAMTIGMPGSLPASYRQEGYYAVNLYYNRLLSDSEIEDVYNYYQSTYSLV